ncbi:SDR family NAD(P)-dependent oxidoreductase [Mangrovimicrobium sediminis]|uniref:SDR family NAD(P)-dependent oxidoreductase n=1 Tax=Mangrovimicrobium sediminis TaxID=2562682 RepID=A0A4Z0M5U1_9GAMM|nr:SDR family NAD(P)-dependent oxidoreductase [Haliea sp. SAOS-164]TGD74777.1 SDR family NAD(P)-dependent oxidoreductase [Haliea sp. SAOS-164]
MSFLDKYGPWALIAGASEGTGRAFAERLAGEGLHCILVARRAAPLQALADELGARHGVECVTASIDLAAEDAVAQLLAAVGEREVGLYISNAGADTTNSQFLDVPFEAWQSQVNRSVVNVTHCCHHFGGLMRERGRGGILLVGSGSCYGGASYMAIYAACKAFDLCFGEGLWAELKPHGVDVLNLILGQTDTPAFRESLARSGRPVPPGLASPADVAERGLARLPFGPVHNWGQEDDVAAIMPSAAERRQRVEFISEVMAGMFAPAEPD